MSCVDKIFSSRSDAIRCIVTQPGPDSVLGTASGGATPPSSAQHKDAPHRSKESVMAATSKGEIRFLLRGRSCLSSHSSLSSFRPQSVPSSPVCSLFTWTPEIFPRIATAEFLLTVQCPALSESSLPWGCSQFHEPQPVGDGQQKPCCWQLWNQLENGTLV